MDLKSEGWGRVKELFQATLEVEPESRSRIFQEQHVSDEIREAVEDLLKAHEEAGSFLNPAIPASHSSWFGVTRNRLAPETVLVDRFRIQRFLAKGGMGEVYEAEDLELHTPVALKIVRPEIADYPGMMSRFKREVHLAKQVTHPNVCRIFDLFRHRDPDGDLVFLSMELLHGQTLAERLRQGGRLEPSEAVMILRQITSALDAAHSAGVLHRDLKPANIVLEPGRNGDVRAVITDFGMAWSPDANAESLVTRTGQFAFGTPEYMSPEQIEGKELTPASDLYSLGLVIYQMITGEKAFGGDTPLLAALRRLSEAPTQPSKVCPELDSHWDGIVAHCLNLDPARRFTSAVDLASALDESMESLLRRRRRPRFLRPAVRSWVVPGPKRVLYGLATVVVVAGMAIVLVRHYRKPTRRDSLTLVLADFVNTTGVPDFDHTLNTALFTKLQQSPYFNLMPDAKVRLARRYLGILSNEPLTESLARQVCLREGGNVVLQGAIAIEGTGFDLGLRAYDCATGNEIANEETATGVRESALTALDQLADAMRGKLGESAASIHRYNVALEDASTSSLEALTAYSKGLELSNEEGQVAAEPYFAHAVALDPEFAIAYARLSSIYDDMGEAGLARDAAIKAYERRNRTSEWERFFIESCYYAFATGELEKEMHTYEEWGRIYPRDTVWPTGLMIDYSYFGRFENAAEMEQRQIQNAPETAAAYGNLAETYLAMERPDEAAAILDEADRAHLYEINLDWERYLLAFYKNDKKAMDAVIARDDRYPGLKETLLARRAMTEAYNGRLQSARTFTLEAMKAASADSDAETASLWQAELALWEAEFGLHAAARSDAEQALHSLKSKRSRDVQIIAALAEATAGDEQGARQVEAELTSAYPVDTLLHQYWLPVIRARVELRHGKAFEAIKILESTAPFETGLMDPLPSMYAVFVRGQAHLAAGEGVEAAADFRKIIAHRGLVSNCPIGALAQMGLAQSLSMLHDAEGSQQAYKKLLVLWRQADSSLALPRKASADWRAIQ